MGVWETGDGGQGTGMAQWWPRQLARLGLPVTSPRPGQLTGGALCLSHTRLQVGAAQLELSNVMEEKL